MENNLQKWFTAAAHAEPIMKVKQVGAMIPSAPRPAQFKPTFNYFIIMGASMFLLAGIMYWMNIPAEQQVVTKPVSKPEMIIRKQEKIAGITRKTKCKDHSQVSEQLSSPNVQTSTAYVPETPVTAGDVIKVDPLIDYSTFQHRIVFLNERELAKLDIIPNAYNYYYKTYKANGKVKATQLKSMNDSFFFAKGDPGKNYFIKPWETDFWPIFLTDSVGDHQRNFHFQDKPQGLTDNNFNDSLRNVFVQSYQNLVPVAIRTRPLGILQLLWYKPTKEMLKKLPDWYHHRLTYQEAGNSVSFFSSNHDAFSGLSLSYEELAGLGIRTDGNTLEYLNQYDTTQIAGDKPNNKIVLAMDIRVSASGGLNSNNTHVKDSILEACSNEAVPLLVTFDTNEDKEDFSILHKKVPYTKRSVFAAKMKTLLVPVVVKTKAKGLLYKSDHTIIFWYKNNERFRSMLPHRYADHFTKFPDFNEVDLEQYIEELKLAENKQLNAYDPDSEMQLAAQKRFRSVSHAELKKLGIRFNGRSLEYKLISHTTDSHLVVIDLEVTPDTYMLNNRHKSGKAQKLPWNNTFAWYVTDSNLHIMADFVDPLSQINDHAANEARMLMMDKMFAQRRDSLLPVLIKFDEKAVKQSVEKNPLTYLVFWFPKSELVQKIIARQEANHARMYETPETAVNFIRYLELTDTQLSALGISREGKYMKVPTISTPTHLVFSRYSKTESEHSFQRNENAGNNQSAPSLIYPQPQLVTDGTGLHWRLYQIDLGPEVKLTHEQRKVYMLNRLNTLIAIRVRSHEIVDSKSEGKQSLHPDLIIWYAPDSLLLSRLPAGLSLQIQDELAHFGSQKDGASCNYFEACSNTSKISDYLLFPNPATDKTTISFNLPEARTLTIWLTDIKGRTLRMVTNKQNFAVGKHEIPIMLEGLKEGLYLVNIETDKFERISQRLIVGK